ncbi:MAG: hypothetical protein DI529_01935 [Chryseobacterium sp.]|nr:MAG: hypothetical protein DI529_01935 [Chryseobacterium sp.]
MKKLYTLLFSFLWLLGFSQSYNSLISSVNWKVVKINWNGSDYYAPSPFLNAGSLMLNNTENILSSYFYNGASGKFIFGENNQNYFSLENMVATLAVYYGDNEQAVQQFDGMVIGFYMYFPATDRFYFDYQETSSGKSLVITNPAGNKVFYSDAILATSEVSKQKISVYPNPAKDYIILDNLKVNSTLQLIDNSGKLIKTITTQSDKEKIDLKNLNSGIYYLKSDEKSVQKIIKQ